MRFGLQAPDFDDKSTQFMVKEPSIYGNNYPIWLYGQFDAKDPKKKKGIIRQSAFGALDETFYGPNGTVGLCRNIDKTGKNNLLVVDAEGNALSKSFSVNDRPRAEMLAAAKSRQDKVKTAMANRRARRTLKKEARFASTMNVMQDTTWKFEK